MELMKRRTTMMTYLCNDCGAIFQKNKSHSVTCADCSSSEVMAQPFDIVEESSFNCGEDDWDSE